MKKVIFIIISLFLCFGVSVGYAQEMTQQQYKQFKQDQQYINQQVGRFYNNMTPEGKKNVDVMNSEMNKVQPPKNQQNRNNGTSVEDVTRTYRPIQVNNNTDFDAIHSYNNSSDVSVNKSEKPTQNPVSVNGNRNPVDTRNGFQNAMYAAQGYSQAGARAKNSEAMYDNLRKGAEAMPGDVLSGIEKLPKHLKWRLELSNMEQTSSDRGKSIEKIKDIFETSGVKISDDLLNKLENYSGMENAFRSETKNVKNEIPPNGAMTADKKKEAENHLNVLKEKDKQMDSNVQNIKEQMKEAINNCTVCEPDAKERALNKMDNEMGKL